MALCLGVTEDTDFVIVVGLEMKDMGRAIILANNGMVRYKKDFGGLNKISPDEPVTNVSYYEADAYSKWAGKRLPTEAEWEKAASWNEDLEKKTIYPWGDELPSDHNANLLESWNWAPCQIGSYPQGKSYYGCHQMLGDVWEWTSSEYVLYPGFRSKFSEYTDKWAINQKVLRGGSFATPLPKLEQLQNISNHMKECLFRLGWLRIFLARKTV